MDKTDITVRQYEALTLICTKYFLERKYPESSEIKSVMETNSERELNNCLLSLDKKGFIIYRKGNNGNTVALSEKIKSRINEFVDELLVTKKQLSYNELKEKLENNKATKIFLNGESESQLMLWGTDKFNFNKNKIIHRWYEYLQDFPTELIWNKILKHNITRDNIILDPFSGSGTTLITAKLMGIDSIGIEANPLMCFVTRVKTNWNIDLKQFIKYANFLLNYLEKAQSLLEKVKLKTNFLDKVPTMELKQWLKPKSQNEVAFTRELIMDKIPDKELRNLFLLALDKAMFESSNVALCPGTSFYPFRERPNFLEAFKNKLKQIHEDLAIVQRKNNYGKVKVIEGDSRKASTFLDKDSVDFLITSPPYPNDLEYTRQTRLEMYLLDFINDMDDVQKIKKRMVRGSTKLIFKEDNNAELVKKFKSIQKVAEEIHRKLKDKNWGWDYPRMVREYFGDMYLCLIEYRKILRKGAYALLVVGDQTYKNVVIKVGAILEEMAKDIGYSDTEIELFRMRRSTIHKIPLPEEIVILRK